jgi:hypothetical protein
MRMRQSCEASPGWRVLGARVLGEFGDDPNRYQTAKGRKAFAGTAPVTRASGLRTVVVARAARNQRLVDACYLWAFAALTASPGARRCYDAHRALGPAITRRSGRWGTGWSARLSSPPNELSGAGCLAGRLTREAGVLGGNPPAMLATGIAPGPVVQVGHRCARSSAMGRPGSSAGWVKRRRRRHPSAGEVGRMP